MPEEKMISITQREYDRLVDRDFKLSCLENGGVENWDWYDSSLEVYWKVKEENK